MKVLHLTLKKKWFDMILSGKKKEEYREIKPYWAARLSGKTFDAIRFTNGYGKDKPSLLIEWLDLWEGVYGSPAWGAPTRKPIYSISLGKIISTRNIKEISNANKKYS